MRDPVTDWARRRSLASSAASNRIDSRDVMTTLSRQCVVDLRPAGDGTIVHLRLLPGLVDDYRVLVDRVLVG
jgi:hypothetical protein